MFERLRRLNDALPGLVVGILLYGVLLELVGVWFVDDKAAYSVGLWYGIAIAIGMAVNMATVIFDSTFEDTDGRTNYRVVAKSLLRYVVVVVLFAVLAVFRFGYVIAAFLGVMGLKISAYIQPLFQKIEIRMGWREPDPEIVIEAEGADAVIEEADATEEAEVTEKIDATEEADASEEVAAIEETAATEEVAASAEAAVADECDSR